MPYRKDPRVLFAAERTLLAWNRTAIALIALGFAIERFGLFIAISHPQAVVPGQRTLSFWLGIGLILFAVLVNLIAVFQFWRLSRELTPTDIPRGYLTWGAAILNLSVVLFSGILVFYLYRGLA